MPAPSIDHATVTALVERYHRGIALFADAVHRAGPGLIDQHPAPGKWSIRQIVCHVSDSEAVAAVRYRMIAAQPGSVLSAFDQEKWESQLLYADQPLDDALEAFVAMRKHNVSMLRGLPLEAWNREAIHEERGPHTLYRMVEHNASHVENHAGQVLDILGRSLGTPAG